MFLSNKISRLFGRFASCKFPHIFQCVINSIYVWIFRIDLEEFAPKASYASLNELFTRKLNSPRTIDKNPSVLISPSDSLITQYGSTNDKKALQIKGMEYSVQELLGQKLASELNYANFYLSPRDYHRYHAPCDMEIYESRYFSGQLLAVNKPSLRKNENLFIRNERVVIVAKTSQDKWLYFVAVGALNVGTMVFYHEPRISTNARAQDICYSYKEPISVKKGDELGYFKMGSTIVLFAESAEFSTKLDEKVKFGDTIGSLA